MISGEESRSSVVASGEAFRGGPGYDPLDLVGYAPERDDLSVRQILLSLQLEDWRGGRIDLTEYVTSAKRTPMHFLDEVHVTEDGSRYAMADVLATFALCATFTRYDAPDEPPRSGIYYWLPAPNGRQEHQLTSGILLVGAPKVHELPKPTLVTLSDRSDEYSSDAHRVLADDDQLAEALRQCALALGLPGSDQQALPKIIGEYVAAARRSRLQMDVGGLAVATENIE